MHIAVVGTGYVGLATAVSFSELGHTVFGIDIDAAKIAMLQKGTCPIFEPGLEEILQRNLASGRLTFSTNIQDALPHVEIIFSAVATPPGEQHNADLRAVFSVAEQVARLAEHPVLFVNKSTVPVGTGQACEERINRILNERGVAWRIGVVSNPEFLREGRAVQDTMTPERIVVGINDASDARPIMEELYRPITRVGKPLLFMRRESAEILKYACNAFLATKISFINMLTELCEKTGGDIRDIAAGMGLDSRIGPRFLHAGIGYGGSCFPKDVRALLATAQEYGVAMPIVEATDQVNQRQRERFTNTILASLPAGATVAVWGLSFKPQTDDMRDAPSIDIIQALAKAGHTIRAFDPVASERAKPLLPSSVTYHTSPLEAAKDADALCLLTEWDMLRGMDLREVKQIMRGALLFDGRNIFTPEDAAAAGLRYVGVGVSATREK